MGQHFTWLLSKREKEKGKKEWREGSAGKDTEKVKLLCTAGGKCKMAYGLYRKQCGTSSKNKSYYTIQQVHIWIQTQQNWKQELKIFAHPCSQFTPNSQKVDTSQVSTDQWNDNKICYTHARKCHSVLKSKRILIHATAWMNLRDIMLSELGQS